MQLDRQLTAWKESIVRAGTLTAEDILELEMHLRDSVQELTARGLSQEEALLVALRRIGDPSVLAVEYQKVNPGLAWARRWYWMAAGFLGFSVAFQGIDVLSSLTAWLLQGGWFVVLTMSLMSYAALAFGMLRSAKDPAGRVARALQRMATWIERHPLATSALGFTTLATFRVLGTMATVRVVRDEGGGVFYLNVVGLLLAVLIPIVLFLLGRYVNPDENDRIENAR